MSEIPVINLCKSCSEVIEKQFPEKNGMVKPVICTTCVHNNWTTLKTYSIIRSETLKFKLYREK